MNVYDYLRIMSLNGMTYTNDNEIKHKTTYGCSRAYIGDNETVVFATVFDSKTNSKYSIGENNGFCPDPTIELEVFEDFFEKAKAILAGESYDERIIIPVDITDEEFLLIARAAHKLDITVNQFIVNALTERLNSL